MKIVKTVSLFLGLFLFTRCKNNNSEQPSGNNKVAPHYELITIAQSAVASTIKMPAQLMAYQQVSIFPKVNGYVKWVGVDIGTRVRKGQLLMRLEAPELEQASLQAREKYERSQSDFVFSRENYERLKQASLTAGAVSPLDLAAAHAKMDADSSLSNAEKLNWQMQQTVHGYLQVTAPFDGIITERNVHPGALVSAEARDAHPMLELKQETILRLVVDVPEGLAAAIKEKDSIAFYVSALPGKEMKGALTRKSMNVNLQYRTERVEIDVPNRDLQLAPGMYADLLLHSVGNVKAFPVPKSAVVTSTERKYVLAVRNGKLQRVDVATGNQLANQIEIMGNLQPGDTIVVHADDEIPEGTIIP